MKYFIIAGEPSGDLHGSNLVRGLKAADGEAEILCWGGDLMEQAGARLLMHYRKTAFMGFLSVVLNIRAITKNMTLCKRQIVDEKPDVLILIDYPGFNLRMAEFAKLNGIRVFYYISPKLWAWKESRVEKIRKFVDRMFIIFPFEVEFYRKHNINVHYYGNPLVDEIERKKLVFADKDSLKESLGLDKRPVISMLAGSRKQEVQLILPSMAKMVKHFPDYQFVLAGVKTMPEELYKEILGNLPVKIFFDKTYELLWISEASLVKSGTSTLEAALIGIPQVVCYRGDRISFTIGRMIVKIRVFSLVNLIMDRKVVTELIQFLLTEENLLNELSAILPGGKGRDKMLADYGELKQVLGPSGASVRIATEMVNSLNN
jgi:lipid-A-disaccharide synthase